MVVLAQELDLVVQHLEQGPPTPSPVLRSVALFFFAEASEDEVVAAASFFAADGEVLQPSAQQLEEREGEAEPLQPGVLPKQLVLVIIGKLPDLADRDDGGVVLPEGLRQRHEVVAVRAGLPLQLLLTHHHIVAPLQKLRPFVAAAFMLLTTILEHPGHVGGEKLGVLAIGEGTLSELLADEPLHHLGSSKDP